LVPEAGVEPAYLAVRDFKSLVSTYFTTRADDLSLYSSGQIIYPREPSKLL
jgi:hypothetical protein